MENVECFCPRANYSFSIIHFPLSIHLDKSQFICPQHTILIPRREGAAMGLEFGEGGEFAPAADAQAGDVVAVEPALAVRVDAGPGLRPDARPEADAAAVPCQEQPLAVRLEGVEAAEGGVEVDEVDRMRLRDAINRAQEAFRLLQRREDAVAVPVAGAHIAALGSGAGMVDEHRGFPVQRGIPQMLLVSVSPGLKAAAPAVKHIEKIVSTCIPPGQNHIAERGHLDDFSGFLFTRTSISFQII